MERKSQMASVAIAAMGYYILAVIGIYLSRQPGNIATIWFANAAAVIALQAVDRSKWPIGLVAIGIAMLLANLSFGDPFLFSASFIPGNLCEIWMGTYLLARFGKLQECLSEPIQLIKTLTIVSTVPPALGAMLGASMLAAYGLAPFGKVFPTWAIGSVIGTLAVFPLGVLLLRDGLGKYFKQLEFGVVMPLIAIAVLSAVYGPNLFTYPVVLISATLVIGAVIGNMPVVALTIPLTTLSVGVLIASGTFSPRVGTHGFGAFDFYLSLIMALLPALFTAASMERNKVFSQRIASSEKEYKDIYNKSPAMMHSLSSDAKITSVSDAWLDKMGYSRDEVLGKSSISFLTPESQRFALEVVIPKLHSEGRVHDVDYEMVAKDGRIINVRFSALWQYDPSGNRLHKLAVIHDVTNEKLLDKKLIHEKTRLETILKGTGVGTWEWNFVDGETVFNDRWYQMLGYDRSDPALAEKKGWEHLVHPDDLAEWLQQFQSYLAGKSERISLELRLHHRNGHWVDVLAHGQRETSGSAELTNWLFGTHLDISEIKKTQRETEEGRYFLERIGQIAGVGAWSVDLKHQSITWSDQTCRIHEVPLKHRPTLAEAVGYYTPESRTQIEAAIERALNTNQGWDVELQITTAKGRTIWTRSVGEVESDEEGTPVRLVGAFQDINARKLSEKELGRLNDLIANILKSASAVAIIATDTEGVIKVFNEGAQLMLGYDSAEVLDKLLLDDLFVADQLKARHSDFRQEFDQSTGGFDTVAKLLEDHDSDVRDCSMQRKSGDALPVSLAMSAMRNAGGGIIGYLAIASDISEKLADQRTIADASQRTALAVDMAEMGLWTWHIASNSLSWNERMYDIYGLSPSLENNGLSYNHWRSRVHPEDLQRTEASLLRAVAGAGTYEPLFRIITDKGELRYIRAAAQVERDSEGKATKVVGINRDITNQVELEESLRRSKDLADQASRSKSSFLANMSHEIRTPMNAVLGMLQLTKRTKLDSQQRDYIAKTEVAAKSLLGLLNDILDFSKIEADKLELDVHDFDLEQLMRDLAIVLSGNSADKDLEILFRVDPRLPRAIRADKLRLQQILINLAGNAIKFTKFGEVIVAVDFLASTAEKITMQFSVTDTGIGIAPEQIAKIFEGFSQAEASTTRKFGGTGLGLSISKKLVELMGGKLTVTSEPGRGSQFAFIVEFPIGTKAETLVPAADLTNLRVLIVDDNDAAREILETYCSGLGWNYDSANSGKNALEFIHEKNAKGSNYNAVLMDWRMPEMDGLAAAREISVARSDKDQPIVLMVSAYGRDQISEQIGSPVAPYAGYLQKPFTATQLVESLERALSSEPETPATTHHVAAVQRLSGLRILVVEDMPINREIASEILTGEGAVVQLAESGIPGVEMACREDSAFDVILMDMQMPDIDGLEATRRIRAHLGTRKLPILAMTANVSASDREACLAAGMNDHVGKPIDIDELILAIQAATGQSVKLQPRIRIDEDDQFDPERELEMALKRFNGKRPLLEKTLARLQEDGERLIDSAASAQSQKDLSIAMHTLKGITATVGAKRVSKFAADLEYRTKPTINLQQCLASEEVARLRRLLNEDRKAISLALEKRQLDQVASSTKPQSLSSKKEVAQQLLSLIPLVEQRRMDAVDTFEALFASCSDELRLALHKLADQIQQLQFAEAEVTLQELINEWA